MSEKITIKPINLIEEESKQLKNVQCAHGLGMSLTPPV